MIQNRTCIEITCDDCEDDCWEDGTPHFESLEQARKYVNDEWLLTEDEQVCSRCVAARACAAEGHVWGEWKQWPKDTLEVVRFCDRCGDYDYAVAAQSGGEG